MTDSSNRPDIVGAAPALLTLGGIGAAFGLAACCAIPMALASFGVGTAWLAGVALFAASVADCLASIDSGVRSLCDG